MDSWVPLMNVFLNSPSPESEASRCFQQSFNPSSTSPITALSFLQLLMKPTGAIIIDSSSPTSQPLNKRVMWIQTLPHAIQSRIISFLVLERHRFCSRDLCGLAMDLLRADDDDDERVDFWVKKAAYQLFDLVSDSGYEWISGLNLDSVESRGDEEFESIPSFLKDEEGANDLVLPWLPISPDGLSSRSMFPNCENILDSSVDTEGGVDDGNEILNEVSTDAKIVGSTSNGIDPKIEEVAVSSKIRIINFESRSKTIALAREISQLCLENLNDSFTIFGLIEPWRSDDETASILITHLKIGSEEEEEKLGWPSQILCSIILPKLLLLEEPASRVLLNVTMEYCKLHEKEAIYALLFPLIYRAEGINSFICDVITRIIKECLHFAHVSAFSHKLLCGNEDDARQFICLPCHKHLLSKKLVWTEYMFNLFQHILNHNVHLTQDSVDHLVYQANEFAERFSKSLKFGNFLLCFVTKCSPLLKSHKLLLTEVAGRTNSLLTKSVLMKLMNL